MPFLFIRTVNETFEVRDDGKNYETVEAARSRAIDAACDIATEEIRSGTTQTKVDSYVEDAAAKQVAGIRLKISMDEIGPK